MTVVEPASSVSATGLAHAQAHSTRRWPVSCRAVGAIAIVCDIAIILFAGASSEIAYNSEIVGTSADLLHYLASATVVATLFVCIMKSRDLYTPAELLSFRRQIFNITTAWTAVFLFLAGTAFALKVSEHFSRVSIFSFAIVGFALLVVHRLAFRAFLRRGLDEQRFSGRRVALITDTTGTGTEALVETLLRHGFQLERRFAVPFLGPNVQPLDGFAKEVIRNLRGSDIEEVIVGADVHRWPAVGELLSALRVLPLPINLVPVGLASDILNRPKHVMGGSVCIELHRGPLDGLERGLKRFIDLFIASVALILLSPLLTITAALIKLDSAGPIFFRQQRLGFNGRPFHILKFRTMTVLEDGANVCQATKGDSRVTLLGRWLRRTSIDELPQLLNILNGTMSLVGPRPHAMAHDNHFDKVVSNYAFRQHVKPGLTGWAQVNGLRGPTPREEDIRDRVDHDLWYIDNWSIRLDLLIVIRTFFELMRGRNAY